jgi:cytochrome b
MRGGHVRRPGHNPLGGWGVVLMLASVALQSVSGLFSSDDISEEGPLVARVSAAFVTSMTHIHHWNRYVLLALITLHAGAVALHWVLQRENLVAPMLHGTARFEARSAPWFVANLRALALFVFVAVVVWAIVAWGEAG